MLRATPESHRACWTQIAGTRKSARRNEPGALARPGDEAFKSGPSGAIGKQFDMKHLALAAALALLAAGCNETTTASRAPITAPGVPIAVDSIAGAPDTVRGTFVSALSNEAQTRQVEIVDPATNPRFRVRGYLAAQPTEDGQTALSFVWDVFDAQKRRAQRVQGAAVARAGAGDWSGIDQTTVSKAASESMQQIAEFLAGQDSATATTTASAQTAAPGPASGQTATASVSSQPGFALRR